MARKKVTPAPSFEDRLNAAHATAAAAASTFELIALDLEEAATQKREIADDITAEISRLTALIEDYSALRHEAEVYEAANLAKADKIRALVSA
jgi:hypothetical protein